MPHYLDTELAAVNITAEVFSRVFAKMLIMVTKILITLVLLGTCAIGVADQPQLLGGYSPISMTDPEVMSAADFAVSQINQGPLVRIMSAESQVVAGINYKLVLEIVGNDNLPHAFSVVVFVPLSTSQDSTQLTNVQDLGAIATTENELR